jgi:hypothetical protein
MGFVLKAASYKGGISTAAAGTRVVSLNWQSTPFTPGGVGVRVSYHSFNFLR